MNKRQSNEMQSIRKKLLAAIAMLLIACIMTVSSTYAWFTLSTAPEVKGITTTVGANGNLEIALGTYETVYGNGEVESGEGTSKDAVGAVAANTTWGNLIDLSDDSYGLGAITLYPTRLNATAAGLNTGSPLAFPLYGTDGRITELSENTMVGKFDTTANGFLALTTPNYAGVNGIGSASDMTDREFAVRNNKNAIETYRLAAIAEAKGALALYSGELAALALENQANDEANVVKAEDVEILRNLITKLEKSNEAIGDSLKSAVLLGLAGADSVTDTAWKAAVDGIDDKDITDTIAFLNSFGDLAGNEVLDVVTDIANDYVGKYETIGSALSTAKGTLPTNGTDSTWGVVKDAVSALLKAGDIKISGYTIQEIKDSKAATDESGKAVFSDVLSKAMNGQLVFQFGPNSGIFADIADVVGAYTSSITFPKGVEVEEIPLSTLGSKPVTVESRNANTTSGDLGSIKIAMDGVSAPAADANAAKALTDTYGYSIDLLFRTNATDSYLNLQTAAANRIYKDNNNEALMGEGSNMSFDLGGEYNKEKIDGLAAGIRVVFYDTTSSDHEILGVAMLDTASGQATGDQYKLDLKLVDYTIGANGEVDVTEGFITTDDANTAQDERVALTALAANSVKKISALVYLDGDVIDNGDAGVADVLNGKLNLQFASSASLTPMNNNTLING